MKNTFIKDDADRRVFEAAYAAWAGWENFRRKRRRNKDFTYGSPDFVNAYPKNHLRKEERCVGGVS